MAFHVGQLVECVDDQSHPEWHFTSVSRGLDGLKRGSVYVVRETGLQHPASNHDSIRLAGIRRQPDSPFSTRRFRPLSETRLAIFRRLLKPVSETERLDA